MAFPPLGNSDQGDALFHHIAYNYSRADWDGLCDHLRDVPDKDSFKLCPYATASVMWVGLG